MEFHIDLRWLLEQQVRALSEASVGDFSALVAAVARHRVDPPRLGVDSDAPWRAAALLVTIMRELPLPQYNLVYACAVADAYLYASDEGIDPPYGELPRLAQRVHAYKADVFEAADLLRSWRI